MSLQHAKIPLLICTLVTACHLWAQAEPAPGAYAIINPDVRQQMAQSDARLSVLVYLREAADLAAARRLIDKSSRGTFVYRSLVDVANRSQAGLATLLRQRNIKFQPFYITNAIALYDVEASLLEELAGRRDIKTITANSPLKTLPDEPLVGPVSSRVIAAVGDNLVDIGADSVWDEFNVRGEGIIVAGQDTGVDWDHAALRNQYRGLGADGGVDHNYHWHDAVQVPEQSGGNSCGYNLDSPCDDNLHGTHTLGTVVGDDGESNQIGVAPGAKWIACRNMDEGWGTPANYIECFEWFLAPYPTGGDPARDGDPTMAPHVINNSWACPQFEGCFGAELLPILETMQAAGIMVVASAGNSGSSCGSINTPPSSHSSVTFSVGAHNHRTGVIAGFSSRGPSSYDGLQGPDITAPGVSVRSAVLNNNYGSLSGTSMAGPHVAGAVALLWSADPTLIGDVEGTADLLRRTATPATSSQSCGGIPGGSIPNNTYGYGRLNVYQAVLERLGG